MDELDASRFTLTTNGHEADSLKAYWDALDLDLAAVADLDLTRSAQPIDGDALFTLYLRTVESVGDALHDLLDTEQLADLAKKTYIWDDDDQSSDHWRPQGISGTSAAYDDGTLDGRNIQVVSWHYAEDEGGFDKGARVTFIDHTGWTNKTTPAELPYKHVLLVCPKFDLSANIVSFAPCSAESPFGEVHAGGVVWYNRYLYVASTEQLLVFDTRRIKRIEGSEAELDEDQAERRCGWTGTRYAALGYRYVIPIVRRYVANVPDNWVADELNPFSTVSLERDGDARRLVCARYVDDPAEVDRAVVLFFDFDNACALEGWKDGEVVASEAWRSNLDFVQGVFAKEKTLWFARSSVCKLTRRSKKQNGSGRDYDWAYGAESLHYNPHTGRLWSCTEGQLPDKPEYRSVFCLDLEDVS
jgi:hypothetical protein